MEPHIRRASPADLPILLALGAEHAAYERIGHAMDRRGDALAAALDGVAPTLHAWLAWQDEEAVGYATATIDFSTRDAAHFLHMDCLYVRAAWRGRGIGLRLWQTLRDAARACGCAAMQWQTPCWNVDAARFYRRLGAEEACKRRYVFPLRDG